MAGISIGSVSVSVVPNATGFGDKLRSQLLPQADALGVELGQHIADGINSSLHDIGLTVTAHADTSEADAALDELGRKTITPTIELAGIDRVITALEDISVKLDTLDESVTDIRLELEDGSITERLDEVSAKLDEIGDRDVEPKLGLDDSSFNRQLDEDMAKLDAANSAGFNPGMGTLITGLVGVGAASLPALPGMLSGAAAGVGTLGLAYEGVSQTLQDYSQAQTDAGKATTASGTAASSAAKAIYSAQQAVSQAQTQAAHDAITSAETIRNAQLGVAQATASAANSQITAEEQLANAQYSERTAQQALTDARQQAILTLQQLHNAEADTTLSAEQAQLDLEQAQLNAQQTNASSTATALQKAQADLSVAEAQQRLKEALEAKTNAAAAGQKADQEGVNGLPAVVAAQHNLAQAHQSVADAQRNLTNTEQQGAAAIAKAQQTLADAVRNASWQQEADGQRVAAAQYNLKAAYASAAGGGTAAANAAATYQQALGKLSPAAQGMVKEIIGLQGDLHTLEGVADTAIAPGVTEFVKGLQALMPEVSGEIRAMGGIISGFLSDIGKEFESSGFQKDLKALFDEGNQFARILGPALGNVTQAFIDMGAKSGSAVTGMSQGLAEILNGFGDLFKALTPFSAQVGGFFKDLGEVIGSLGGPLGQVLGTLMSALDPLLTAALPLFESILTALQPLFTALSGALKELAPELGQALGPLVQLADTFLQDLAPVLPQIVGLLASLASSALSAIAQALGVLLPPMTTLVNGLFKALAPVLPPIITALEQVGAALAGELGQEMKALAPALGSIAQSLAQVLIALTPIIPPVVTLAADLITLSIKAMTPLIDVIGKVADILAIMVGAVADVITWIARIISAILNWVVSFNNWKNAFGAAWNWVVGNVFHPMETFFTSTIPGWWDTSIRFLNSKFVQPFQNDIKAAWTWVQNDVLNPMETFFTKTVPGWFDTAVSAIGVAWGKLGQTLATPVNWVIDNVLNPLINAFDTVTNALGLGKPIPKLSDLGSGGGGGGGSSDSRAATGGVPHAQQGMRIPGYGGGDQHLVLTEAGETILPKEATGDPLTAAVARKYGVPGFETGGIIPGLSGIIGTVASAAGRSLEQLIPGLGAVGAAISGAQVTGLLNKFADMGTDGAGGVLGQIITAIPKAIVTDMESWLAGHTASSTGSGGGGGTPGAVTAGVARWASDILQVLKMLGLPASDLGVVEAQMQTESGGNEAAINLWDSNAKAGTPSKGLMQVIDPTFAKYRSPALSSNIYDPLANIYAGLNYAIHEYGTDLAAVFGHGHGYDTGGWLPPGLALTMNGTGRPEPVFTPQQWDLISQSVAGGDGTALADRRVSRKLDRMIDLLERAPGRTGAGLGEALNGTARGAVRAGYFKTR